MITIRAATVADLDAVVESESKLFRDDAGVHDRHVDITWPARLGHERYGSLIDDNEWLMLVATHDAADTVIGHLVGSGSKPGRLVTPVALRRCRASTSTRTSATQVSARC